MPGWLSPVRLRRHCVPRNDNVTYWRSARTCWRNVSIGTGWPRRSTYQKAQPLHAGAPWSWAATAWIDATLDAGDAVPAPSSIETLRARAEYAGWAFGVIAVDPAALDSTVERVNITLPRRILLRLDAQARAAGESRSGYIAHLTMEMRGDRHA